MKQERRVYHHAHERVGSDGGHADRTLANLMPHVRAAGAHAPEAERLLTVMRQRLGEDRAERLLSRVGVGVTDHIITLHGTVHSFGDWEAVVAAARLAALDRTVEDELRITQCC